MLGDIPGSTDARVLVDFRSGDDAGVYRWEAGPALVQTVDFFTPIVDDPETYGRIAAANALSDVYAMGGEPLTALAIAAFPAALDVDIVRAIFRGGLEILTRAGVALLGGHTVQDREIKFGYAVTGRVDPAAVWTNAGARPGDVLVLTKPLGTGIITTALKRGRAPQAAVDAAVRVMVALNDAAARAFRTLPPESVHACTDVTGFGLVGHACEMARASGCTLRVVASQVPAIEGAMALAIEHTPGGGVTNEDYFGAFVAVASEVSAAARRLLYDPQTSGGLLAAVRADDVGAALDALGRAGVGAAVVGEVLSSCEAPVVIAG